MAKMGQRERDLMVEESRAGERTQPGAGRMTIPKDDFLKMLGLKGEFAVTGVSYRQQTLYVDLVSSQIHWQGGAIVQTDPVLTDTQERGEAED